MSSGPCALGTSGPHMWGEEQSVVGKLDQRLGRLFPALVSGLSLGRSRWVPTWEHPLASPGRWCSWDRF